LYGEGNVALSTLKSSTVELEKKEKEYQSKAKAVDEVLLALEKARASNKSKTVSKLESKEDKAMNALSVAQECYEYQLKLTNERVFESYNEIFIQHLNVRKKLETLKILSSKLT